MTARMASAAQQQSTATFRFEPRTPRMAGEGARTGTVSAGETDVGNSATIAAFHEILRRMLVGSVHLASLARAWKPRPAHRSHHECGIRPLRSYRRGNSRLGRLYQMVIVAAPVRLLRL